MNIVFQGDSATDSGRDRSHISDLGDGYPNYAAAMIQDCFSSECDFTFASIAASGKDTSSLLHDFESDFAEIRPDILSIMIGVDAILKHEDIDKEKYRSDLTSYIRKAKDELCVAVMLIQPYISASIELTDKQICDYMEIRKINDEIQDKFADAYLPLPASRTLHCDECEEYFSLSDDESYKIGELYLRAISPIIENIIAQEKS